MPPNESFADATPLAADGQPVVADAPVVAPTTEPEVQDPSIESFDSPLMTDEETAKALTELDKGQVKKLDEEEVKDEVKDETKKDDKEPKDENEEVPKKEEDEPPKTEEKSKGKTIRLKDGDDATDVSLDATIPLKVKGKKEFVSIKELRDSYSGQKAWSEEIETARNSQEKAEQLVEKTNGERQEIMGHLSKLSEMLDADDFDPIKPLAYLVEMRGGNVLDFTKKAYSALSDTIHDLDDMDDVERKVYWQGKELQFIKDNQATREELSKHTEAQKGQTAKIDALRESQGVSEGDFVEAYNKLLDLGYEESKLSPEAVVNYSVMRPHYEKAEGITGQFEEDLTSDEFDTLVEAVSRTSMSFPKLSDQEILEITTKNLGWQLETDEGDIDELNSSVPAKEAPNPSTYKHKETPGQVESFDDFDQGTYGRNYG